MGGESRPEPTSGPGPEQPQTEGNPIDNTKTAPQVPRFLGTGRVQSRRLDRKDKSLSFFPLTLQGSAVVLELRNNVFLRGMLYMADIHMKCAPGSVYCECPGAYGVPVSTPRCCFCIAACSFPR